MKVLWLYRYIKEYDFDNWLHMRFAEHIANSGIMELIAYGPELHVTSPSITPIPYNSKLDIYDLYSSLKFDVIIINTKSRMFEYYNPHTEQSSGCWLPQGLTNFDKVLKLVIEEDYHYEKNDKWYQDLKIDAILQRHYASSLRQEVVPMFWFPFSVDTEKFHPKENDRINRICFAGSVNGAYPEREEALKILKTLNAIDVFSSRQKTGISYVECLQNYICHLSGTSRYKITPAKMFEIMASGSILLTNDEPHLTSLFDEGSYVTYHSDWLDKRNFELSLIKATDLILHDFSCRKTIVEKSLKCIKEKHTHEVRIKELYNLINQISKG